MGGNRKLFVDMFLVSGKLGEMPYIQSRRNPSILMTNKCVVCVVTIAVSDVCPTLVSLSPSHHRCFHPINPKRGGQNKEKIGSKLPAIHPGNQTQHPDKFGIEKLKKM